MKERLLALIEDFGDRRVLVVGDIRCRSSRRSAFSKTPRLLRARPLTAER